MNFLSSDNGYLSRIRRFNPKIIKTIPDELYVVVSIAGERFIMGKNDKLLKLDVEYNVKGGGICKLEWANTQFPRVGAPVEVTIGDQLFWSGKVINGKENKWQAEPLHAILEYIIFYDKNYDKRYTQCSDKCTHDVEDECDRTSFKGTVTELIEIAFEYVKDKYNNFSVNNIINSSIYVVYEDINNNTIYDILKFCEEQLNNPNIIWGIDNDKTMYFKTLENTKRYIIREDDYVSDVKHSIESDNVVTVYSVFQTKKAKVTTKPTNTNKDTDDEIEITDYLGRVGIGNNDISKGFYPPVSNYYIYGYKEKKYEIDASTLHPDTILRDVYNVLQNTKATEKTIVKSFDYMNNYIPVGAHSLVYTRREINRSFFIPMVGNIVIPDDNINGMISIVEQTPILENLEIVSGILRLKNNKQWMSQVALIDRLTEMSIGYVADKEGFITLKSKGIELIQKLNISKIQSFVSFTDFKDVDKEDIELSVSSNITIVSLYATSDYGKTFHEGYLRSVKLKSSVKGNLYDLTIFNYGALPVLTLKKQREQLKNK